MTTTEVKKMVEDYLKMTVGDLGVLETSENLVDNLVYYAENEIDKMGGDFDHLNDLDDVMDKAIYNCKEELWESWLHSNHLTTSDLANSINKLYGKSLNSYNVIAWLIEHEKSTDYIQLL